MERSVGRYHMSIQQNIPPAPNEGPSTVDWLPMFAGFSWQAYGAHFSVVISIAPSPSSTGEVAMGGFFQQVLSIEWPEKDEKEKERVSAVGWAPRGASIGSLAAAAGNHIFLYGPEGMNSVKEGKQSLPEVPLRWAKIHVLEHFSKVYSFSWSESGDGLLSAGREIVMWQKGEDSWNCLWRSLVERPHSLSAASWSVRGIAATAEGARTCVAETQEDNEDQLVKIWWWEDGEGLQELELSHPHQLLMIQWRPIRGFGSLSESFRPVLMTCCQDGVVRLWAEIGNLGFPESQKSNLGNNPATHMDQVGANEYASQCKLAFFVSAVIDVNSTLKGVLGHDIYVTWPEARGGDSKSSSSSSSNAASKESDAAMNEVLVGIGPCGSVTLWSVQSLDDLSPARGSLLQLWHQKLGLLPLPAIPSQLANVGTQAQMSLQCIKVVVHRPQGTSLGPPTSLDVFEIWSPHLLRWSSIWPPVSAIGGHNSKAVAFNTQPANTSAADKKMSTWGISSETVVLSGHNGKVTQIAVHPIAVIRLVASLDDHGVIILWISGGLSANLRLEVDQCPNPVWKLSGQLEGHRVNCTGPFNSMAWAPVVLPSDDAVLLLGHPYGVDCYVISRKLSESRGKLKSLFLAHKLLYTIDWPLSENVQALEGVYAFPFSSTDESPHCRSLVVVSVGDSGTKLATWKLDVDVRQTKIKSQLLKQESKENTMLKQVERNGNSLGPSAKVGREITGSNNVSPLGNAQAVDIEAEVTVMEGCLIGFLSLPTGKHVTSIAVAGSECHSCTSLGKFNEGYDVVTGCADGAVRMWKLSDEGPLNPVDLLDKGLGWQCVGLLRIHSGPVAKIALCYGASKFATIGNTLKETASTVHIWGEDTFIEEKGFCLEAKFVTRSDPLSLSWLDGGNGLPVLGVATESDVQLFAECRVPLQQSGGGYSLGLPEGNWVCLASSAVTGCTLSSLSWESQGSLVVTCGGHILLYFNQVVESAPWRSDTSELGLVSLGTCQAAMYRKVHSLDILDVSSCQPCFPRENGNFIKGLVGLHEDDKCDQEKWLCSIVEAAERIGHPLLDYHPTSILSWIKRGKRPYARASIRHLASYLTSVSVSSSVDMAVGNMFLNHKPFRAKVPHIPLRQLFQDKENFFTSFGSAGNAGTESCRISDYMSTSSRGLQEFPIPFNNLSKENDQGLIAEPNLSLRSGGIACFTKNEVDVMSNLVKKREKIPGLSSDEKRHLLALINILAEMDGVSQPSQIDSLDLPGQRFWLAFRFTFLEFSCMQAGPDRSSDVSKLVIDSKAMAWALHSEYKEILLDLCLPDNSASWSAMRALGVGYWFTDAAQLRKRMEKLARAQYLENKDPKDCALLYLALDRRSVLAGLFRLSRDQRDRPLADFLLRDFQDDKNKIAALKNAYVLMGKHRLQLAAAFFLLGGDSNAAAVVCAKNLGDTQLALVVSYLLDGVGGPTGHDIILKYALPSARQAGDIWLASLLQWSLGKGIESIQELSLQPFVLSTPYQEKIKGSAEGMRGCPVFPLDCDIGSYCALLGSKPRLRTGAVAAEASAMGRIAATRSAAALKRSGLGLQVLDYLERDRSFNHRKSGRELDFSMFSVDDRTVIKSASSSSSDVGLTDVGGREVALGWVSVDVVTEIKRTARFNLVLRHASSRLQDHPHWGDQRCAAWQVSERSPLLSKQKENITEIGSSNGHKNEGEVSASLGDTSYMSSFLQEADTVYDDDLQLLERKYLVNIGAVAAALSTTAHMHHHPFLFLRLVQGYRNYMESPDLGFHVASMSTMSVLAAQYLETFAAEAPQVLTRTVLACGCAATASKLGNCYNVTNMCGDPPFKNDGDVETEVLLGCQFDELVRFGGEIQLLTNAACQKKSVADKESCLRAMALLSFTLFVAAAWLGRKTKALYRLIAPTVIHPSAAPEVPSGEFDAVTWFHRLGFLQSSRRASYRDVAGKRPVDAVASDQTGTVTISDDDAWRVLGISLWSHLLIYVKKQLTGTANETLYSSFSRRSSFHSQSMMKTISSQPHTSLTSNAKVPALLGFNFQSSAISSTWLDFKNKIRDSYPTQHSATVVKEDNTRSVESRSSRGKLPLSDESLDSAAHTANLGGALLSSLTSVVAGLRKQLAAHLERSLKNSVRDSVQDPLVLWLWGESLAERPNGGQNSSTLSSTSSSDGLARRSARTRVDLNSRAQVNLFPKAVIGSEDEAWKDLWELLVVREKISSALGLEGVSGQIYEEENDNMSGWYLGRKGRSPTTQIGLIGVGSHVNTIHKVPPKRIMWNTVKGVPNVSDQGAILSSRRHEENYHSELQLPEDSLHLSEEFSEDAPMMF